MNDWCEILMEACYIAKLWLIGYEYGKWWIGDEWWLFLDDFVGYSEI